MAHRPISCSPQMSHIIPYSACLSVCFLKTEYSVVKKTDGKSELVSVIYYFVFSSRRPENESLFILTVLIPILHHLHILGCFNLFCPLDSSTNCLAFITDTASCLFHVLVVLKFIFIWMWTTHIILPSRTGLRKLLALFSAGFSTSCGCSSKVNWMLTLNSKQHIMYFTCSSFLLTLISSQDEKRNKQRASANITVYWYQQWHIAVLWQHFSSSAVNIHTLTVFKTWLLATGAICTIPNAGTMS